MKTRIYAAPAVKGLKHIFYSLQVVFRWRNPQIEVGKQYQAYIVYKRSL